MKKFLCMMLAAAMLFTSIGLLQLTAFAATEELLENGNLEEGDETGFFQYGGAHDLYVDAAAEEFPVYHGQYCDDLCLERA